MQLITLEDTVRLLKDQALTYYFMYLSSNNVVYFYKAMDLLCWSRCLSDDIGGDCTAEYKMAA